MSNMILTQININSMQLNPSNFMSAIKFINEII